MTESKKQSSKGCGKSRAVRGVAGRTGKGSEMIRNHRTDDFCLCHSGRIITYMDS